MIGSVRGLFELLLFPVDGLPEGVALAIVSVVTGVLALYVVKWTTDQARLAQARDQLASALLEVRLFLDSPRRVWKAQGRVVAWTARYMVRATPALLVMIVPFTLLFLHLYVRHELAPLPVGEDVLVKLEGDIDDLALTTPPGVEQTAPLFRGVASAWYARVRPTTPGRHTLRFEVGGGVETKLLVVGDGRVVSPETRAGLAGLWALTGERARPSLVRRISVEHPAARRSWLGMPWWLVWLLASTAAALGLRRPLGVVI